MPNNCQMRMAKQKGFLSLPEALEEQLTRLKNLRKSKLAQLTSKAKLILTYMKSYENSDAVEFNITSFTDMFGEFIELQRLVQGQLPDSEKENYQLNWYAPKVSDFQDFQYDVEKWQREVPFPIRRDTDECVPVGKITKLNQSCSSKKSSSKSSSKSSTTSAKIKSQAEHAALMAHAATMEEKHALEKEQAELKLRMVKQALQTEIAASKAKVDVLEARETTSRSSRVIVMPVQSDSMNDYLRFTKEGLQNLVVKMMKVMELEMCMVHHVSLLVVMQMLNVKATKLNANTIISRTAMTTAILNKTNTISIAADMMTSQTMLAAVIRGQKNIMILLVAQTTVIILMVPQRAYIM